MSMTVEDLATVRISGVSELELETIRTLLVEWRSRRQKNVKRSMYYDAEQAFKDLGIALAPQLKNAKFYLGWATMAVKKAAIRSQFDGLRLPGSDDPLELGQILTENRFDLEFSQSVVSAYKHGPAFTTVAKGEDGESAVQIQAHSAEWSSALWDRRKRRVSSALTITDLDVDDPKKFIVYLPDAVLTIEKGAKGWLAERVENKIGRTLVVPTTYDPQLGQPFGRSRISNPVMALTDMAVRAYVRMEGNAEFYSSPQMALLGIDEDAFEGAGQSDKFRLAMERILLLTRDEDGNVPSIQQLQQATMTPHSDYLRTVAMAFSGETGIPPASLGVIHDNPSSAEAIRAAEHDLLIDVTYQNKFVLKNAVEEIARMAVMVRDGLTEPPAESWKLSAKFVDPEFRSLSATADGITKIAAAFPDLASNDVLLEQIFDEDQMHRIQDATSRAAGTARLSELSGDSTSTDASKAEAELLKTRADAVGVLRRAGVEADEAAKIAGLPGLKFWPGQPITLREA